MRSLSWRVVPAKQGNLTEGTLWREGAGGSKELLEGKMMRTLCLSNDISTRQEKIAQRSRQAPSMVWTTLAHHIDVEWLGEAYRRTRKDGAVGVDGVTAQEYEAALLANLEDLLERFRTGRYRAPPVRRVHIGKDGAPGKTRPIGIPTLEDKILQRAVLMVLEPMYEQDFLDCSHGFRPGRGAHRALEPLWKGLMDIGGGWVIDLDIQSFFDTVSRKHLRSFLDRRVRDGVIRRVIGKWLKAGVMEEGAVWYPEEGTPQGGVISPLLSNLYLHEVLDRWFEHEVKPRLKGRAFLVRYADDAVLGFEFESDARRVMAVLAKRFSRYGLTLHPEKTRLVDFRNPARRGGATDQERHTDGHFDMLGFTHFWARSRKGRWIVKRKTATTRLSRAVMRIAQWCRAHRHSPIAEQQETLNRKLRGHYAYYGVTGNARALSRFLRMVERAWRKWLSRRSRSASLTWPQFKHLLHHYPLMPVRVVHSIYPRAANP
jgi:RNA-directed DNA polymerase